MQTPLPLRKTIATTTPSEPGLSSKVAATEHGQPPAFGTEATSAPRRLATPADVATAARLILDQCAVFLSGVPDTVYVAEAQTVRGGSVGKHVRHVLDHFSALLAEVRAGATAAVDYDHRARGVPSESDKRIAMGSIESITADVRALTEHDLRRTIRVRVMITGDGTEAELESTVARELAFVTHHAVHHHAMMKTIAGEFGIQAEEGFGKAPSTLNYLKG
jgi:uncharacterized damage-inducible protein DinB